MFQVMLIVSGNLSFLNWLTILPAILCFDDRSLRWLFSSSTRQRVVELQHYWQHTHTRPLSEQPLVTSAEIHNLLLPLIARRLLHPSGIFCWTGSTAGLPEHPCGSEPPLFSSAHEYFVRLPQNSQHLWGIWQVRTPCFATCSR